MLSVVGGLTVTGGHSASETPRTDFTGMTLYGLFYLALIVFLFFRFFFFSNFLYYYVWYNKLAFG